MNQTVKANLAALTGNGIFGLSFLFSAIALEEAAPFVLLSVRFITAFLVLNLFLHLTGRPVSLKGKPVKRLLLMGLLEPVIYFICESYGISMTSSSFSGVMIGLIPVMGLVFGVIFLHERWTPFQAVCTVMSVVGVALTTTGAITFSMTGFLLLLVAVVSAALFTIVSRSVAEEFTAFERTYVMLALGSISFTAMALIQIRGDLSMLLTPMTSLRFWGPVLYLAVVSSVCAFALLNYALNFLSAGRSLIYANFTTVVSVLAGIFVMGDSFTPVQLVGMVIITLSVFGVSLRRDAPVEQ